MSGALLDILLIEKNESILQDYWKIKRNSFPTTKEWDYLIDNKEDDEIPEYLPKTKPIKIHNNNLSYKEIFIIINLSISRSIIQEDIDKSIRIMKKNNNISVYYPKELGDYSEELNLDELYWGYQYVEIKNKLFADEVFLRNSLATNSIIKTKYGTIKPFDEWKI